MEAGLVLLVEGHDVSSSFEGPLKVSDGTLVFFFSCLLASCDRGQVRGLRFGSVRRRVVVVVEVGRLPRGRVGYSPKTSVTAVELLRGERGDGTRDGGT